MGSVKSIRKMFEFKEVNDNIYFFVQKFNSK